MMPRDKLLFAVQGVIAAYVLYQVTASVYNHLKAKDRLKRKSTINHLVWRGVFSRFFFHSVAKLLYKDNVD